MIRVLAVVAFGITALAAWIAIAPTPGHRFGGRELLATLLTLTLLALLNAIERRATR